MERLWAPWRMEFIRETDREGCFLCEALSADPAGDRENLLLRRGGLAFVMMNRYPYNTGHLLIAPCRHEGSFSRVTPEELSEIMRLAQRALRVVERSMRAEGFNIGLNLGRSSGAGLLDHLHLHVVPRWGGDTNFMPVLADTHVMPQALLELYDELKAAFDAEGGLE